jgi:FkbM family methyltransferase
MLGGRPLGVIARNAVRPANYRALLNMPRRYPDLGECARRYFRRSGDYPYRCRVSTPQGIVTPTLWSWHDMLTVNEVFCREDYRAGADTRVVVDIGSNIGISALYFLTRHSATRCFLYEPVARNVERLRLNLSGFQDRYEVQEVAVAEVEGQRPFAVERTGRYGSLDRAVEDPITVHVRHVNNVLDEVLGREPVIDILKLDTEGAEIRTVGAICEELLPHIRTIYLEASDAAAAELPGFSAHFQCETLRLANQTPAPHHWASA